MQRLLALKGMWCLTRTKAPARATLATLPPMAPMTPQRMPLPAPPPALADSSPAAVVVVWLTWEDVQAVEPYIRDGAAQGHGRDVGEPCELWHQLQ